MEHLLSTAFSVCRFRREDGGVRTAMSSPRGTRMRLLGIMKDASLPVPPPQPPKSGLALSLLMVDFRVHTVINITIYKWFMLGCTPCFQIIKITIEDFFMKEALPTIPLPQLPKSGSLFTNGEF